MSDIEQTKRAYDAAYELVSKQEEVIRQIQALKKAKELADIQIAELLDEHNVALQSTDAEHRFQSMYETKTCKVLLYSGQFVYKGVKIPMTKTELMLLAKLVGNPGHLLSREVLMDAYDAGYITDRTVDSHIKRLRRKVKDKFPDFNNIITIYGMGYKWEETP